MWPHGGTPAPPSLWDQVVATLEGLDPMAALLAAGCTVALVLLAVALTSEDEDP